MININNYKTLEQYIDMFLKEKTNLLMIEGDGGVGKSATVDKLITGKKIPVIDSHLTPLSNYIQLYRYIDKKIVYRDIDQLLKNPISVSLLKQVAETKPIKTVSYNSQSNNFPEIPQTFETTSTILIETNNYLMNNPNVRALATRGQHINFSPTTDEIMKKMQEITAKNDGRLEKSEKKEVYLYLESAIGETTTQLNLRHLVHGFNLYDYNKINNEFNWKEELKKMINGDEKQSLIIELSQSGMKTENQYQLFKERHGLSRAQFFRLRKAYL